MVLVAISMAITLMVQIMIGFFYVQLQSLVFILLTAVVFLQSFIVMYASEALGGTIVLMAVVMALVVVSALTLVAFTTEKLITVRNTRWFVIGLISAMVLPAMICIPQNEGWNHMLAGLFVLLYIWIVVRQMQKIVKT